MFYKSLTQIYAYLVCAGCVIGMLVAFNTGVSDLVDVLWDAEPNDYNEKGMIKSFIAFISFLAGFAFHWRMAKRDKASLLENSPGEEK